MPSATVQGGVPGQLGRARGGTPPLEGGSWPASNGTSRWSAGATRGPPVSRTSRESPRPRSRRSSWAYPRSASRKWSAAQHARCAWSSCAMGAPKSAMMPSPVYWFTVPSKRCTPSARISKNWSLLGRRLDGEPGDQTFLAVGGGGAAVRGGVPIPRNGEAG